MTNTHKKLKVLDLFSGIGGFSLGLERTGGFETVAFCEIEKYPRKVLAKHWPDVPIYEDVKKLTHEQLQADGLGRIDIITAGYPCQPFSAAGQRRGKEDDRHLWPEVKRLMATVRPRWGLFENVAGHISMGLDEVLSDLENEGYAAWPCVIPACAVNAVHRRDRVWIICNANKNFRKQQKTVAKHTQTKQHNGLNICSLADTSSVRHSGSRVPREPINPKAVEYREADKFILPMEGPAQPAICGGNDGVSSGVDRLKGLGN